MLALSFVLSAEKRRSPSSRPTASSTTFDAAAWGHIEPARQVYGRVRVSASQVQLQQGRPPSTVILAELRPS